MGKRGTLGGSHHPPCSIEETHEKKCHHISCSDTLKTSDSCKMRRWRETTQSETSIRRLLAQHMMQTSHLTWEKTSPNFAQILHVLPISKNATG